MAGNLDFVEKVKSELGFKAAHRAAMLFSTVSAPLGFGMKVEISKSEAIGFPASRHTLNVLCVLSGNRVSIAIGSGINPCSCM
jgi:hypothetical protein